MRESTYGWRFTLLASAVRVFVNGAIEGLPGYIEVHQLPAGTSFFMAVDQSAWGLVEKWGHSSCLGFKLLEISDGVSSGCRIYSVEKATSDDIVKSVYPVLSFPTTERIRLQGQYDFQEILFSILHCLISLSNQVIRLRCSATITDCLNQTGEISYYRVLCKMARN